MGDGGEAEGCVEVGGVGDEVEGGVVLGGVVVEHAEGQGDQGWVAEFGAVDGGGEGVSDVSKG